MSINMLASGRMFSTFDMASVYWHVPVADESWNKTAFSTNRGKFEFNVLHFGMARALYPQRVR